MGDRNPSMRNLEPSFIPAPYVRDLSRIRSFTAEHWAHHPNDAELRTSTSPPIRPEAVDSEDGILEHTIPDEHMTQLSDSASYLEDATGESARAINSGSFSNENRMLSIQKQIHDHHNGPVTYDLKPTAVAYANSIRTQNMSDIFVEAGSIRSKSTYYTARDSISTQNISDILADARSIRSRSTYHTADSVALSSPKKERPKVFEKITEYTRLLRGRGLLPVDPMVESNWSGRGQHVEFGSSEKKLIDQILRVEGILGSTSSAVVQSVRCKRILLARKTIRCNRRFTKAQAMQEVAHLSQLKHSHILQLIGTYSEGNNLSILLYPVADYNLEAYLEIVREDSPLSTTNHIESLSRFFRCLAQAVNFIHDHVVKHMDIKPKNLLVRDTGNTRLHKYKIYIADFGIARSYPNAEAAETDGATMFTRKYAAPEVVDRGIRGLSADIFSLGCVFLEILVVLLQVDPSWAASRPSDSMDYFMQLEDILATNEFEDSSYQANLAALQDFVKTLETTEQICIDIQTAGWGMCTDKGGFSGFLIPLMLRETPSERLSAAQLCSCFAEFDECCSIGAEPLEAQGGGNA